MNKIGQKIKELREENNLSMIQLAKKIDVSDAAICKWENGASEPKATYIHRLAVFFNVTTDYLLGLENDFGSKIDTHTNTLSKEEEKILSEYRNLLPRCKDLIKQQLEVFNESNIESKAK